MVIIEYDAKIPIEPQDLCKGNGKLDSYLTQGFKFRKSDETFYFGYIHYLLQILFYLYF